MLQIAFTQTGGGNHAVVSGIFLDADTSGGGSGLSQRFVTEPGNEMLVREVGATSAGDAVARQYHLDALGSVEAVIRQNGATEADYRLDAFGNALPDSSTSATTPDNPFIYHGCLRYWSEPALRAAHKPMTSESLSPASSLASVNCLIA